MSREPPKTPPEAPATTSHSGPGTDQDRRHTRPVVPGDGIPRLFHRPHRYRDYVNRHTQDLPAQNPEPPGPAPQDLSHLPVYEPNPSVLSQAERRQGRAKAHAIKQAHAAREQARAALAKIRPYPAPSPTTGNDASAPEPAASASAMAIRRRTAAILQAIDLGPEFQPKTPPTPPIGSDGLAGSTMSESASMGRFYRVTGAIAATLLVILAWSLRPLPADETAPQTQHTAPPTASTALPGTPAPAPVPVLAQAQAPANAKTEVFAPPRRLANLLAVQLARLDDKNRLSQVALGQTLGPRITVFNVWASYCEPCMDELPRLHELFDSLKWGSDLRLVPVLFEELDLTNRRQQGALRDLRGQAAVDAPLVDLTATGVIQVILHEAGLLPERAILPVTFVLDCEQRLRWLRYGAITNAAELAELSEHLQSLRQELPRCPTPRPAATPGEPLALGHNTCGDGYCERQAREDCQTCPADCGCKPGYECMPTTGMLARCNLSAGALKD